jgi:hypothetical protein
MQKQASSADTAELGTTTNKSSTSSTDIEIKNIM